MSLLLQFDTGEIESLDERVLVIPSPGTSNSTNILRRLEVHNPDSNAYKYEVGFLYTDPVTKQEEEVIRGELTALAATTLVSVTDELYVKKDWALYLYIRKDATDYQEPFRWFCHWAESGPT